MVNRVFVKVVGFSPVERHALNTIFRLSQEAHTGREISYEPWQEGDNLAAQLVLVDGSHADASVELNLLRQSPEVGLIWVGAISPANAWRTFQRPLRWPDVLTSMDMYFAPPSTLDIDFSSDNVHEQIEAVTLPAPLSGFDVAPEKRALIVDADRDARLYLRSKLAALGITQVDEADTVEHAKALLQAAHYHIVSMDLALNDQDPWSAVALVPKSSLRIVTAQKLGLGLWFTAKINRCAALEKPLHPGKLQSLLQIL